MESRAFFTRSKIKIKVIIFIFFTLFFFNTAQSQSTSPFKYLGFEGTFGVRSFKIKSFIPEVDGMPVIVEGGSVGVIFGNDYLQTKVRAAGFYYSASSVPRTVDLFESEVLFNFHPLEYFREQENRLDIYAITGVAIDNVKFYGHYLADNKKTNYSTSSEPYLATLSQINITGGLGLQYRILLNGDFVHLFAEGKYYYTLHSDSNRTSFKNTSTENFTSISVGVSFGLCHNVRRR